MTRAITLSLLFLFLAACSSKEPSPALPWKTWADTQAQQWLVDAQNMQSAAEAYCSGNNSLEATRSSFTQLLGQWAYINGFPYKAIDEQGLSFALYFWPDKRNQTEIRLSSRVQKAVPLDETQYDQLIAAEKGIPALEWLLFKEGLSQTDRCTALMGISEIYARDVDRLAQYHHDNPVILPEWTLDSDVAGGRSIALNLLYAQVSRMESHLRQSRDEEGLWVSYLSEGWLSGNTWFMYQKSLTSLLEMLDHTRQSAVTSSTNQMKLGTYLERGNQILESMAELEANQQAPLLSDSLEALLLELTDFLENDMARNYQILIGFNNFDGD